MGQGLTSDNVLSCRRSGLGEATLKSIQLGCNMLVAAMNMRIRKIAILIFRGV